MYACWLQTLKTLCFASHLSHVAGKPWFAVAGSRRRKRISKDIRMQPSVPTVAAVPPVPVAPATVDPPVDPASQPTVYHAQHIGSQ